MISYCQGDDKFLIYFPSGGLSGNSVTGWALWMWLSAIFRSHPRQPTPYLMLPIWKTLQRWSFAGSCFEASPNFLAFPTADLKKLCWKIFSRQQKPRHSELCSQKFLSTSSRVSLDDLIISRKAATPLWLRISELFKKNCWWHRQGMRDTLDLSSYHRELSSRIASDINFPFHSFASRRNENSFVSLFFPLF